jgi:hypothetical protein
MSIDFFLSASRLLYALEAFQLTSPVYVLCFLNITVKRIKIIQSIASRCCGMYTCTHMMYRLE